MAEEEAQVAVEEEQPVAEGEQYGEGGEGGEGGEDEADPRLGEYVHPRKGVFPTYLFENARNTRLYFDEAVGQWARMPLSWERNVPEIKAMLDEIDGVLPLWRNVNEQLLVLRECNYDLEDAIVFAEINWGFSEAARAKELSPVQAERTMRASMSVRRASFAQQSLVNREKPRDLGPLSVAASSYIHELESKVAALQKEAAAKKSAVAEEAEDHVASLVREKTVLATKARVEERALLEAKQTADELSEALAAARKRAVELEKQVVALQADNERLQGGAAAGGSEKDKKKGLEAEVDKLRADNVALKLKVTQFKSELEDPTKSPAAGKLFGGLHAKAAALRREKDLFAGVVKADLAALAAMFHEARRAARDMGAHHARQLDEITQKYRAEALQRKLLYNKVQELRGNIRVFCRVRPDKDGVVRVAGETDVVLPSLKGDDVLLEYDHVYGAKATQEEIFADTKPIVLSCIDGYNVCLMAYGQTGSGKTYTMMGPTENPGVNRRAIRELLQLAKDRPEIEFTIKVSLMEVYNENLYDLLSTSREKLAVHQNADGVYVPDLTERVMQTQADIEAVLEEGNSNRTTASTKMNTESSRSHLLLQIYVTAHNTISKATNYGKLTLVDLAGSERVSKTEAAGDRLVEAAAINKSLTSLGQVFKAIQTHAPHIPYRNSKLTHVLQDSLGGDSKTAVFINVRAEPTNLAETHATLNFGQNIRKIELGPASKHKGSGGPPPPPPPPAAVVGMPKRK